MRRLVAAGVALALATALTACTADTSDDQAPRGGSGSNTPMADPSATDPGDFAAAVSDTEEDSVYPDVGDPSVDALHYQLQLTWDSKGRRLTGTELLHFRSTVTADHVQLDLEPQLEVRSLQVDGVDAAYDHSGKDLVIKGAFAADQDYDLMLLYSGSPQPVQAPTTRTDFSTTGFTVMPDGTAWTMQEPYGAYTWYAVNDQPADKAYYDFTLTTPAPSVGVANGTLVSRGEADGSTVTHWHLDSVVSSYLVTVAFGDYAEKELTSSRGVPITLWTPKGTPQKYLDNLGYTPDALDWVEGKLGAYPWSSLGVLLVPSNSGMETQTMITLGSTDYTTEKDTLVHEIVHQWYGDEVTPDDWRDLWMNEGMAMYLQFVWQSENLGQPLEAILRQAAGLERRSRRANGPPARYDPKTFAEIQVYYGPALMWDQIRRRVGDETFWAMVKAWPPFDPNGSAGRGEYLPWIEKQTGADLKDLFRGWLFAKRSPKFS